MNELKTIFRPYWALIAIALFLAFMAGIADQAVPRFLRSMMDALTNTVSNSDSAGESAAYLLLAMASTYIGAQVLRVLQRVAVERAATRVGASLMTQGMATLIANSMSWHLDSRVGQVQVRLERSTHAIAELLKIGVGDVVGPLMGILFASILLFETSIPSGTTALAVALALCGVTIWQIINQNGVRVTINRARESLGADIVDSVTNVETVKLYGAEHTEIARVEQTSLSLAEQEFTHHKVMAKFDVVKALIDHGGFGLVVAVGIAGEWNATTPGVMVLIILCYQRMIDPLRSFHRIVDQIAERLALAKDYFTLREDHTTILPSFTSTNPLAAIEMREVAYTYPGASQPALTSINLNIPYGARVALVGGSGEGKSTIAKLISGLFSATSGEVVVAGQAVQPIELQNHDHRAISVLTQDVRLFGGTVIENIRYGSPHATDEELFEAAKAAGAFDLLFQPDGSPRIIRARWEGVSGGQRQRIGIARVLLRNTPILLLDEPTNGQDPQRRKEFFDLVFHAFAGRTVVIITHDTADLSWATQVIRVQKGRLTTESVNGAQELPTTSNLAKSQMQNWDSEVFRGIGTVACASLRGATGIRKSCAGHRDSVVGIVNPVVLKSGGPVLGCGQAVA